MDAPKRTTTPVGRTAGRRTFLKWAVLAGGAAAGALLGLRSLALPAPAPVGGCTHGPAEALAVQAENVALTGVRRDGIPSVDRPVFVAAEEADAFVEPGHIVFGLALGETVRAYPQRILVWHEIVNDAVAGEPLVVTYCPLTGSQVAFRPSVAGTSDPTFGVTGRLVNSNLLLYDRTTESEWPQIAGWAIHGPRHGEVLERVPLAWTTWSQWRARHPDTEVLSPETGFARHYRGDPYGSYNPLLGYYADDNVRFPVVCRNDRFHPKRGFVGLAEGTDALVVAPERLRQRIVESVSLAGHPLTLVHDAELNAARAYRTDREAGPLTLVSEDGLVDRETGSRWTPEGRAVAGPLAGTQLEEVPAMNVMWFAWAAFHPWTRVLASS